MNRAGSFILDSPQEPEARRSPASWYTPGLSDGLGDRLLMFDNSTASSLELLRFQREFSDSPAFEAALRERIERLETFSHPSVGRVRALESLGNGEGLALISNQVAGRRLSEILHQASDPTYAMELVRQLTPALAALQQQDAGLAHGALTAERIVVTPEGRLVIVEHVLGSALESLHLPASRLRSELGIAVAVEGEPVALDCRADVVQLALMALSLLLGRRVDPADYPNETASLLDEVARRNPGASASRRLRPWLERALQINGRTFDSAQEAHEALHELPDLHELPEDRDMPPHGSHRPLHALPRPADSPRQSAVPPPAQPAADFLDDPGFPDEEDLQVDHVTHRIAPPSAGRPWRPVSTAQWVAAGFAMLAIAEAVVIGGLTYRRSAAARLVAAPPAAGPTAVVVESSQPGAEVLVDGQRAGLTPFNLNVGSSTHSIRVVAPEVPPGTATRRLPTAAAPGLLEVTSDPPGARVSVDGTRRGVTPLSIPIAPGQHAVIISDGTTTTSRAVTVVAGGTATVIAALVPAGAAAGWVSITAPLDLQVLEGGTLLGTTSAARLMLPAGHHELELTNAVVGFKTTLPIDLEAGKTVITTVAVPNGSLSINALPWANVWLDGRALGTTPVANFEVPLGTHEIVWKHPQLGERRQTVVVTAKSPLRLVMNLSK